MKLFRFLLVTALLVLGSISAAFAQDVVLANGTGFTIHQLALADSNSQGDAEDLLGSGTLAAGASITISISGDSKGWELIAVDGEGTQVNWQNLDLTGVRQVVLHANGTADLQ
jgi:hypothetical protein